MKKEDYIEPTEDWLKNQFKDIPLSIIRPSEIELILSYFIIYHNDYDIEAGDGELAVKYQITESKARRLKIEFAQRYGRKDDIANIIAHSFENNEAPFELSDDEKNVYFMIRDPYELKLIKDDLMNHKIVYQGDFNGKLIKLSIQSFIKFMMIYYDDVKKLLKKTINDELDMKSKNNKEYWESLNIDKKIGKAAPHVINGILSLIGIGTSLVKG
jgi:hypothetical protein